MLEESKLLMYRFHYEVMIPLFGWENLTVTMSDTDSYMYRIIEIAHAKIRTPKSIRGMLRS